MNRSVFIRTCLCLFFLGTGSALAMGRAQPVLAKSCVLEFERPDQPMSKQLMSVLANQPNVYLVVNASPKDLLDCMAGDYQKVAIIAHALQMDSAGTRYTLGYFEALTGNDRARYLEAGESTLTQQIAGLEAQVASEQEFRPDQGPSFDKQKLWELQDELKEIRNLSPNQPVYGPPQVILPRTFQMAEQEISSQAKAGGPLREVLLMSCASQQIQDWYSFFGSLKNYGVQLKVAPESRFWSWVEREPLTIFNPGWLLRTLAGP